MKKTPLFLFAVTLYATAQLASGETRDALSRARTIGPFLDDRLIGVAYVDVTRVNVDATLDTLRARLRIPQDRWATISPNAAASGAWFRAFRQAGGSELYCVLSLADLPEQPPFVIASVQPGGDHRAVAGLLRGGAARGPSQNRDDTAGRSPFEVCEQLGDVVFAGSERTLERLRSLPPREQPELAAAFRAAGDAATQFVLLPSKENRRVLREMFPRLPDPYGDVSGAMLVDAIRWVSVGVNSPPDLSISVTIQSTDDGNAAAVRNTISQLLRRAASSHSVREKWPGLDELARVLIPHIERDQLTIRLNRQNQGFERIVRTVRPTIERAQKASRRTQVINELRGLAVAMNNYVSAYGHYPPAASRDPEGRKLLSWRVHVLQFGDESQQQLYSQFHLNEPWDSEHNRKFIERMPKNYASPGSGFYGKGLSNYLVPVGEGLAFSGTEGIPLKEFKDGISRTIFIVDVDPSHAVIWTKPEDLDVDLQQPFHGLINDAKLEFVATRGDATVTVHDKRLSADALRAMFTRNGGEHLNR